MTGGFAGKYTPRQIDNIVAQIVSLGSKAISSDYPIQFRNYFAAYMEQRGMRYNVAPNLFPGWLSDELVIGMGRSMKLTSMLVKVSAYRIPDERNSSRSHRLVSIFGWNGGSPAHIEAASLSCPLAVRQRSSTDIRVSRAG